MRVATRKNVGSKADAARLEARATGIRKKKGVEVGLDAARVGACATGVRGVDALIRLEPVEYGGTQTGSLYRRAQVKSLLTLAARRASRQTAEWLAEALEDCLGGRKSLSRQEVLTLAELIRGERGEMEGRLDLSRPGA